MDSTDDRCSHCDFSFAFNDSNFSDRVLRIYIFPDSTQSSSGVRVKTMYISSSILAARSPFFYKLFSNGMKESKQYHATLRINASEEAGLMELLKFMYSNNLSDTTASAVFDVLKAADKFNVASCMRHCSRLLRNLPMTPEFVVVYLDLPPTILMAEAFQQLTVAAKQFCVVYYKDDITKFEGEILSLPLAIVEAIIASDDLQVPTEDEVYSFVLNWARAQYAELEDRREAVMTHLAKFIRFPYMTHQKLIEAQTCKEFDPVFARKVVNEAISFQCTYTGYPNSNLNHRFVKRAYEYQPVKMLELTHPHPRLIVYLELNRDECASLFPQGMFYSRAFMFGGHVCYFHAECDMDQQSSLHSFKLHLGIEEEEVVYSVFDYDCAARSKPTERFVSKSKGQYACKGGKNVESRYLFEIPWTSLIEEDSVYFINGALHVRLDLMYRPR
ncbi:putative chromatin remodeling & transcription regulator BTB-POZ family [Helianthus annuus]|nr:putative chromatin remodeling & transcription regulator BTB-POZ family [Helianthus annuus]KAJ0444388.1 putative chromatin remodeling & transcription regulator BTB-POZ family [Helianthus annuus]KAJ0642089.1 putative chromatin remodeling & transcription regulator BTB-POZ family [Helianthus annuus]